MASSVVFEELYCKYKDYTIPQVPSNYMANLRADLDRYGPGLRDRVWRMERRNLRWNGRNIQPDRDYFLFDSFQGHVDPQQIDGPAAFAWQADKNGPYFNNAVVGPEVADAAMKKSGAKNYRLVKGWFEDTLATFTLRLRSRSCASMRLVYRDNDLPARTVSLCRGRWKSSSRMATAIGTAMCARSMSISLDMRASRASSVLEVASAMSLKGARKWEFSPGASGAQHGSDGAVRITKS